tara:strand:- start:2457 stop:3266 length:810 start_codon:yes stop_codon:yes gene_type:complete
MYRVVKRIFGGVSYSIGSTKSEILSYTSVCDTMVLCFIWSGFVLSSVPVCFDANVYEFILDDLKIDKNDYQEFKTKYGEHIDELRKLIVCGAIQPLFSEALFQDELIPKKEREHRIENYTYPRLLDKQPTFNDNRYAFDLYQKALQGYKFKLMYIPAFIGGRSNSELYCNECNFLNSKYDYGEIQDRLHFCRNAIDKEITLADSSRSHSENADRDQIASCYTYGIAYFCSLDSGKSDGVSSIMHKNHRSFVREKFNVQILSPKDLVQLF